MPRVTVNTDYTKAKVSFEQKMKWTNFTGDKRKTPFVASFPDTVDYKTYGTPAEFDNAVDVPCWDKAKPDDKFAMTMKYGGAFDGTGGETFRKRAKRKADSYVIGTFKTEEQADAHPLLNGFAPYYYNVFIWDREGNLVNGVY